METGPQTGLPLAGLITLYRKGGGDYCVGMILNDIGAMTLGGCKESESFLMGLLTSEDCKARLLSFCFLTELSDKTKETVTSLADFEVNPVNTEIVARGRDMLLKRKFHCC